MKKVLLLCLIFAGLSVCANEMIEDYIEAEDIDGSCLLYAGKDITNMIVKIKNELDN